MYEQDSYAEAKSFIHGPGGHNGSSQDIYARGIGYALIAQVEATDRQTAAIDRLTAVVGEFFAYAKAEDQAATAAIEQARAQV